MKKKFAFSTVFFSMILLLTFGSFVNSPAQQGTWIEQVLPAGMSGTWLADRGSDCLGYTKSNSQYIYFFDINISQWSEVDLGSTQLFHDVEASGHTILAYTDEFIIGYSSLTSQWDTLQYQGSLINSTGPGELRSYGCGEKLAYFVTNTHFYVFDAQLGVWQIHSYTYPGAVAGSNFWSGDDYIGAILSQNPPNYALNMAYSIYHHAFKENLQGGYYSHTSWGMTGGFVTTWSDNVNTYILTGYSALSNQFSAKTLLPPFGSYEGGNCLFPDQFLEKTVAVFHYRETLGEVKILAYDTRQGQWFEATHFYDPQHFSQFAWWHYGGRVAGTSQYNTTTRELTYLVFDGASGSFNTLTPSIYYSGAISGFAGAGGDFIVAYDTLKAWFFNPGTQNSQWVNLDWHNPTGYYLGDHFAVLGNTEVQGGPLKMYIYNSSTNQVTTITPGNSPVIHTDGSPIMCGFTAGPGRSEVYIYSGLLDDYQFINYPPNSYPSLILDQKLAVAQAGSQAYLYDATTNAVYSIPYQPGSKNLAENVAIIGKNTTTIEAYSIQFQQLTELTIPEGVNTIGVKGYLAVIGSVGFTNYYAYNGFYNNLVPLQPAGMGQGDLVGEKTAMVIRVDRIYAFDPQAPTSIDRKGEPIKHFSLAQNYPNPFNPVTTIRFALPERGKTSLKIYDVLGREIGTLLNRELLAGSHRLQWNAGKYPSGVYYYRLDWNQSIQSKKMILLK